MAFAARKHDDGTWRLCKRMGDTILRIHGKWPHISPKFASQAKTKACADELNERFWTEYDRHERKHKDQPNPLFWELIEVIYQHGGLTDAEYKEITQ